MPAPLVEGHEEEALRALPALWQRLDSVPCKPVELLGAFMASAGGPRLPCPLHEARRPTTRLGSPHRHSASLLPLIAPAGATSQALARPALSRRCEEGWKQVPSVRLG